MTQYQEKGVSLLDIMVVIAILGIIASMTFPYIQDTITGSNVMQVIEQMRAASTVYRQDAMSTGTPVIMSLQGCSVSATYSPSNSTYEALPSFSYPYNTVQCSSSTSTLVWMPDGLLTNATGNLTSVDIHVSGGGVQGHLYLHGGGSIDAQ